MIVDIFPKSTQAHHDLSVTNTVEDLPLTTGCWLVGGDIYNPHMTNVAYLQVFGVAAADVTLGGTTPIHTQAVPPLAAVKIDVPRPLLAETRLSYAVTATRTGNGVPLSPCDLSIIYSG